jgi:hypothetical protein
MPFSNLHRNTCNQTTRRADTLRKISSENLSPGNDYAHKITSRIQHTRSTHVETVLKNSSRRWETERRLNPRDLTRATRLRVKLSLTFTMPTKSTLPFPLFPKVILLGHH